MEQLTHPITTTFDFHPRTRIVFGAGVVERVGEVVREAGGTRVLLVTDPGIVAAGHAGRVHELLESAGLFCVTFDQVHENPTTVDVDRTLEVARAEGIDFIVALGGGSSMDAAKGCNFLLTNGGRMADYWGRGKAQRPMLPLVAVPTTAGTGSETQSFALISDAETHRKMACGDPKAAARVAIIDPTLAVTQPRFVSVCTGLDAVTHAVESAVTRSGNAVSRLFSRESFALSSGALPRVLEAPDDLEAQGQMMLAAAYAGLAIENSMLGAAHSMANPLTARYGVVHGQAVGTCLPHVVTFNRAEPAAAEGYAQLAHAAGLTHGVDHDPVDRLIDYL
ncbi:MAG: iron-containing alcohol dehydrogenase, partial [Planctomycetota bacterium]